MGQRRRPRHAAADQWTAPSFGDDVDDEEEEEE